MSSKFAALLVVSASVCASCTEFPPSEQPFEAMPAVKKLHVAIAPARIASADRDCKPEVLAPQLDGELEQALKSAGYAVVRSGEPELTLTLTLEAADCATLDAAVQAPATVSIEARGRGAPLFQAKEAYFLTRNATVQSITYADWAARLVNDLSRSREVVAFAASVGAPPPVTPPLSAAPAVSAPPPAPSVSASASAPAPAFAFGKPHPEAHALVIGVSDYRALPRAPGARADAERFAQLAKTSMGVEPSRVHVLTDANATADAVDHALAGLARDAAAGDRIYLFFAGDGSSDRSGARLELYEGEGTPPKRAPLSLATVAERLRGAKVASVVAILDAGFSGAGERAAPNEKQALADALVEKLPASWVIVSGAKRAQATGGVKGGEGGLFASTLFAGIGGAEADVDGDQAVSLAEISAWVGPRVTRAAKEAGREQSIAVVTGSAVGDPAAFALATGLARAPR